MIKTLALTQYFGLPAVAYGGLITLILLITTLVLSHQNIKYHRSFALVTLAMALLHGLFGLSIFLGF